MGCGGKQEDVEKNQHSMDVADNVEDNFTDEKQLSPNEDEAVAEVERLQQAFMKAMQDYSEPEWFALLPEKDISNIENGSDEEGLQDSMGQFQKVMQTVYGDTVQFDYVQTSFEELDVEKLNRAIQDDDTVDIVETLNKRIEYILESGCNLQRCIKSDMEITIDNGQKNSVQTESSFVYEIDGQWYIDGPFDAVFYEQKKQIESSDEDDYDDEDDSDEEDDSADYSSLLVDQ